MKYPIFSLLSFAFLSVLNPKSAILAGDNRYKENKVYYKCAAGKTLFAAYRLGNPGQVRLKLGDGRSYRLAQAMAASGVRYATHDEKFVFWSKGDRAFILENEVKTYHDCNAINQS